MNLEEKYQLNQRFPIRLSMLKHSIRLNLDYAKKQLKKNRFKSVKLAIKLAEEDIDDLQFTRAKQFSPSVVTKQ